MFLERLKEKDYDNFAKIFDCSVEELSEINNNQINVKFFNGVRGPQPEFNLSDFYCKYVNGYYKDTQPRVQGAWRKFLRDKFGEEYGLAFKTEFERVKSEMDKIE